MILNAKSMVATFVFPALFVGFAVNFYDATIVAQESSRRTESDRTVQEPASTDQETEPSSVEVTRTDRVTSKMIDGEIANVESAELEEEKKAEIKKHYVEARQFVASAEEDLASTAGFRQGEKEALNTLKKVRENLESFDSSSRLDFTVDTAPDDLPSQSELELQQSDLNQRIGEAERKRKSLSDEVARREERNATMLKIETESRERLEEVQRQLAIESPDADSLMAERARKIELEAERQSLVQKLEMLPAERAYYAATADLPAIELELNTLRLERLQKELKIVNAAIAIMRERALGQLVSESLATVARLKKSSSKLLPIAERNLFLAQQLRKKTEDLEKARKEKKLGQEAVQKVESELSTMRKRVDNVGLSYEMGEVLRRDKIELMARKPVFDSDSSTEKLQEIQFARYRWQDERDELSDLSTVFDKPTAVASVETEQVPDEELDPDARRQRDLQKQRQLLGNLDASLQPRAEELLKKQRDLLGKLEGVEYDRYLAKIDIQTSQNDYAKRRQEFVEFLDERILWVRSEPVIGAGDIPKIQEAGRWLLGRKNWARASVAVVSGVSNNLASTIVIVFGLIGLLLLQTRSRKELKSIGAKAIKRSCREFRMTMSAFLQTTVLAVLWPAIGLAIGWLMMMGSSRGDFFVDAIGRGLMVTSIVALPFELMRCVCKREGLAKNHFEWSEGFRIAVRENTRWFLFAGLPLLFLVVVMDAAGGPTFARLGRIAIMGLLLLSAVFSWRIFCVFRPGGAAWSPDATGFDLTVSRMRSVAFLLLIAGSLLLVIFAAMGYYESVYKIGGSLLQTTLLLIGAVIVFAMALRFLLVRRRKLRFEQLIQQRKTALAAAEKQAESGVSIAAEALDIDLQNEAGMDITDVSRQARELTGVIFLIVLGLILLAIWQYLLPATKILDSWELWPITIGAEVQSVTARDVLLSIVVFVLTFFGVRNIPGMLELLLLQRLPLDAGARYAVTSILRYILLVVGVIVALGYLKIPWSNYSWLVAAISVGLGFGLQEIVANFVSGLILLLERPVRVGDVVTIDGVTGIVSRIQMRATTVTNWENQELVVPNKDLISGKLLNWTLSNVINRVTLKVGVAYGSDVAKVRELITKIVERHPDVLSDPAPFITFEEFGDSSLNFGIRCCTTSIKRRWQLVDEVNSAINEAFEREGIEIPFPQRVVHMVDSETVPEQALSEQPAPEQPRLEQPRSEK